MVGPMVTDRNLQRLVDKSIRDVDRDKDGKVGFNDFLALLENHTTLSITADSLKQPVNVANSS